MGDVWDEMSGPAEPDIWAIIGMNNRMKKLADKMHFAAVEGKLIKVWADDELLGVLALDYQRERQV